MVVFVCLTGQSAHAHAFLERAVPAVGADVAASPPALTLTYSEPVEPVFSSVAVTDPNGNRVDQGRLEARDDGHVLVVPLKPLPAGAYAVEWHVTSVDTHKTQGHFSFSVKP
jgi:copper resistance protein C